MLEFESKTKSNSLSVYLPLAKTKSLVVQETKDELLIYNLHSNKAVCLNQTAAMVWRNCDGKTDVAEITKKLEKKFGYSVDSELVWFALDQLKKEGLLVEKENLPDKFTGLSRREVIKKVGFSSMIALPIISSIVAPKAIHAQSCVNPAGAPPGSSGSSCFSSSVPQCQGICNNSCCSGSGTLIFDPGMVCNGSVSGCGCTCNP